MSNEVQDTDNQIYRPLVLIADDSKDFLDVLKIFFKQYDKFDVDMAHCGKEVIDKVNTTCYDALVLDIKFSDILGTTIAELVQKYDPLLNIAFLTGYSGETILKTVKRLGAHYWTKPVKDIYTLAENIYDMALEHPCNVAERKEKREEAQLRLKERKNSNDYIEIPTILLKPSRELDNG